MCVFLLTPTIFVIEILIMKAANGNVNPGVPNNFPTDSMNGGSSSPEANFSISELTCKVKIRVQHEKLGIFVKSMHSKCETLCSNTVFLHLHDVTRSKLTLMVVLVVYSQTVKMFLS